MGGGNAQKTATSRAKHMAKAQAESKGSQLKGNAAQMTIKCTICQQPFAAKNSMAVLKQHSDSKHPKDDVYKCFPHLKEAE